MTPSTAHLQPQRSVDPREREAEIVRRCADAALGLREPLREEVAHLRLAAALLRPRFPEPARRLDQATAGWSLAEDDLAGVAGRLLREGTVTTLPRFRELLERAVGSQVAPTA